MIEIVRGPMNHPDSFHHTARPAVFRNRERDDLAQIQAFESERDGATTCFGRVAVAPVLDRESPTHLYTWREVGVELWDREADKPGEPRDARNLYRPQTKTMVVEVSLDPIGQRTTLFGLENGRQVFHDARIRVQGGKRVPIRCNPSS